MKPVSTPNDEASHRFIVLDPGHFHAALVLKRQGYPKVSNQVATYAPVGDDFTDHMGRVIPFNTRKESPADWQHLVYLGPDYQEKMLQDRFGDIVILSGRNDIKIDRISTCIQSGYNVLVDKPWIIHPDKFPVLESVLSEARTKGLTAVDIMTERHEITSILQRLLVADKNVFGEIVNGTPDEPAIIKKSVHHLYKIVAGRPNKRPWWFFDTSIQGEGVADVNTHLVDLVFWILFPDQPINYKSDIQLHSAKHWATVLNTKQFARVTGMDEFPEQFKLNAQREFPYFCNGSIVFTVNGITALVQVEWHYQAPEGAGDTHYSIIKGTKAHILILQGQEQNFKPELYIKPVPGTSPAQVESALNTFISNLAANEYPGFSFVNEGEQWRLDIPDKYRIGHEAHFGQVTDAFLNYLSGEPVPEWEYQNMLSKYYVTTQSLLLCQ